MNHRQASVSTSRRDSTAVISPSGRFEFQMHRAFRGAAKTALADPATRLIEVDLSGVEYLDSSALGMLLLTMEDAEALGKQVSLVQARGTVDELLQAVDFERFLVRRAA